MWGRHQQPLRETKSNNAGVVVSSPQEYLLLWRLQGGLLMGHGAGLG